MPDRDDKRESDADYDAAKDSLASYQVWMRQARMQFLLERAKRRRAL